MFNFLEIDFTSKLIIIIIIIIEKEKTNREQEEELMVKPKPYAFDNFFSDFLMKYLYLESYGFRNIQVRGMCVMRLLVVHQVF